MSRYFDWPGSLKRMVRFDAARAEDVNDALDELTAGLDLMDVDVDRAIKLPKGTADQTLALTPAQRAGLLLAFDGHGNITAVAGGGRYRGDWATNTSYVERDYFRDPASKNIYTAIAPHVSGVLASDVAAARVMLMINVQDVEAARLAAQAAATTATHQAALATAQADAARSIVNFIGVWSELTGPLNKPATVYHAGQFWALLNNLANVALSEPGVTGDWVTSGIPIYTYDNRANLRGLKGGLAVVEGLGLFSHASGSDEPDDDESCFATATGRWLLAAVSWDVVDAWRLVDEEEGGGQGGDGIPGSPGPPGPPGPPGSDGTTGALLIDNRLSEFAADPAAQQQARDNLGIPPNTPAPAHIDGGSF